MARRTWILGYVVMTLVGMLSASPAVAQTVYVVNAAEESVSVIDPQTGTTVAPRIKVGQAPNSIAISPDGKLALVGNFYSDSVSVINTSTNRVVGTIPLTYEAHNVAIAPDGTAIVTSGTNFDDGAISRIDPATRQVVGKPIPYEHRVHGLAITPDGLTALTANEDGEVLFVDLTANRIVGHLYVGGRPSHIAVTPDGRYAVVPLNEPDAVAVIDLATRTMVGQPIPVAGSPYEVAISPDGRFAYVGDLGLPESSISKIDIAAHRVIDRGTIKGQAWGIALSSDGSLAYIAGGNTTNEVETIDTATLQPVGEPVPVGFQPDAIAAVPAQSPQASFTVPTGLLGAPTHFAAGPLAAASATYDWSFGDGTTATGATVDHTYATPGAFQVTLTVGDGNCSVAPIFTGQTAYCSGSPLATTTKTVAVPPPSPAPPSSPSLAVRVACPAKAQKPLCRFKLRAVTGKKKGATAESALAHASVPAGKSKLVRLEPRPRFAAKLATARRVLVRERRSIGRKTRIDTRWVTIIR
jgi:YVTN family beta-propeller protein